MRHVRLHVGAETEAGPTVPGPRSGFTLALPRPFRGEWAFWDYERVCIIWFNPEVRMSLAWQLFLAFALWFPQQSPSPSPPRLCLPDKQVSSDGGVFHAALLAWYVGDDLRPSVGARRRDSRAAQRRGCTDFDRRRHCFLWRDDGEHQYSLEHLILFDSFFESGSIKLHRDNMKHFAAVLHSHPEQNNVRSFQSNPPKEK